MASGALRTRGVAALALVGAAGAAAQHWHDRRRSASCAALLASSSSGAPASGAPAPARSASLAGNPAAGRVFDVAVIGGGVVGLAVARECAMRGHSVVLLEQEDAPAAGASSGNSGLGCTGYDAPVGSLERALLRRSIQLHQHLYRSFGLSHEHVRKSGSLVVAWDEEQLAKLPAVLEENREAGDSEAQLVSREELRALEPALGPDALGAVLCPREAVVEPWLVPVGYAESARLHGAELRFQSALRGAAFNAERREWSLLVQRTRLAQVGRSRKGELLASTPLPEPDGGAAAAETLAARVVVNCAGLFGDKVEQLGLRPEQAPQAAGFTVTPRKGQFVVFKPRAGDAGTQSIIEPVATQFTKGVIVWTTVYGNVVVGPTAVDQPSRTDRSTDSATVDKLRAFGLKVLPALKDAQVLGTYSGLRPATEHRDYQIRADGARAWITVAGIRSTGLTASSGIAEYVADLHDRMYDPALTPWAAQRRADADRTGAKEALPGVTEVAHAPVKLHPEAKHSQKVPTLKQLADEFKRRGDGYVTIYGRLHRVTHPISSFGLDSL
jgi:glycerol-3-phosphate dehydrogenase